MDDNVIEGGPKTSYLVEEDKTEIKSDFHVAIRNYTNKLENKV